MNVVLVAPFGLAPKGTVSRRLLPLARALAASPTARVTALIPPWDSPQHTMQAWTDQGVAVVHVGLTGGVPGILGALLRVIWQQRPDVVHCFKPKGYAGLVLWVLWHARRAGRWRGRLLVDTDDWEAGWNDRLAYPRWLTAFFAGQEGWCLRHADAVTAASCWLVDLAAGLRHDTHRVCHLPNGVDASSPVIPRPPAAPHVPTALLYTRFVEVPPRRVLRVWHAVRQLLPDARLIVVGDSLRAGAARQLAGLAGPDIGLRCLGWVPAQALPGVLAGADVAWVPSPHTLVARARCPVKLVELMQAGLPVVADASGEVLTYVRHGVDGVLVTAGDDDATAKSLVDLLTDRTRAQAYGQAAAARVHAEFTWEHLVPRVQRLYRDLVP